MLGYACKSRPLFSKALVEPVELVVSCCSCCCCCDDDDDDDDASDALDASFESTDSCCSDDASEGEVDAAVSVEASVESELESACCDDDAAVSWPVQHSPAVIEEQQEEPI